MVSVRRRGSGRRLSALAHARVSGTAVALILAAIAVPSAALAQQAPSPEVVFVQEKNPAAAGLFSFLIPGGGQVYNGQIGKGLVFFGGTLGAVMLAQNSIENGDEECARRLEEEPGLTSCSSGGGGALLVAGGLWVVSIVDAVRTAKRLNAEARARVRPMVSTDGRIGFRVSIPTR